MLVDTGAAASIISEDSSEKKINWPIKSWKRLEGFNGATSLVPFTKDLKCKIGTMDCKTSFGIKDLNDVGIIRNNILTKLGIIIDIPNRCLWSRGGDLIPLQISNTHRISAIKYPDAINMPTWDEDVDQIVQRWIKVFSTHKLQCGKIQEEVNVIGPDPPPQKQYQYPIQAQASLHQVINVLMEQQVIVPTTSTCNAPLWPVKKADVEDDNRLPSFEQDHAKDDISCGEISVYNVED